MKKLVAVLLLVALAGCARVETTGGSGALAPFAHPHSLVIADGTGDIPSLNPHLFTETTLSYIAELTMAYLARYDSNNKPIPELATIIPTQANGGISKDGKTITWHLRHGVKWSDGAPFNADDVIFSTQAVLNPANNETGRDGWNLIAKMDEPDKYTVVYHLSKPYGSYLPTFFGTAGANPCILPKHLLGNLPNINHAPYNAKPVGIGPFRVVEWRRGDAIEMEANPYYWRGEPKLKHITFRLIPSFDTVVTAMQTGEVNLWPLISSAFIDRVKAVSTLHTIVQDSYYFAHIDFQVRHPIVSDPLVRQAIRYALNRPEEIQKINHGYGIAQESMIPPSNPLHPTDIPSFAYDPAKAMQLLDQAGWKPGPGGIRMKNGQRLSLTFPYYTGSSSADQFVELVRQELAAVGVEIQTRKYAPALFFAQIQDNGIVNKGDWDMTTFSWSADPNGDLSNIYECDQIPPNGQNSVRYCNPKLDKLLEQYKLTYDFEQHKKILNQEVKIIVADAPTIVTNIPQFGFSWDKHLTGYAPNSVTPFDDMMNVDIK
ncbi:MAG: peptide ABC transporter substrate-binding protein [Candidatus Baltobacteraceae bacterium]